jgi:hypothetical protein
VGDKDGLFDGMVERLLGHRDDPVPDDSVPGEERSAPDWRTVLHRQAAALRETARRHPAAFSLLLARRAGTAGALRARDDVLHALAAAGVSADRVPAVERLLSTFVIGFAASEASGRFADRQRADADFRYAEDVLTRLLEFSCAAAGGSEASPRTPARCRR